MSRKPKGYWTRDSVIREMRLVSMSIGRFPDKPYLESIKRTDLTNAVRAVGLTFRELRDILGFDQFFKPVGYWNKDSILQEMRAIEFRIKKFPTAKILSSLGRHDLVGAIATNKMKFSEIRKLLGYEPVNFKKIESNGDFEFWDKDLVVKEISLIESKLKKFPTQKVLNSIGRSDLSSAISNLKIKYSYLRSVLGYPLTEVKWVNKDDLIDEFKKIEKEIGCFPTQRKLRQIGRKDVISGIDKHKISYRSLKGLLGYKLTKPVGYWDDFNNLAKEIDTIIKDGKFPSLRKIQSKINTSARIAVRSFGGIREVAKRMGYEYVPSNFLLTSDGHYVQSYYEYLFDEYLSFNKIPHEVDGLIVDDKKYRYDFKVGTYYFEIWGFSEVKNDSWRKRYLKKRRIKEKLYRDNKINLISIESSVFAKDLTHVNQCFNDIFQSLNMKVSGHPAFKTNYSVGVKIRCGNKDKTLEDLKIFLLKHDDIPSLEWIGSIDPVLYKNINNQGGKKYFFKKLGLSCKVRQVGKKWTKDKILSTFREISEILGHFPTEREIKQTKYKYLQSVAYRNGLTLTEIASILGYKPRKKGYNHVVDY